MNNKIAIVISTRNREKVFKESYKGWLKHLPKNTTLMVVDDASDDPYHSAAHRFDHNVGIAKTKNKCIELAYNSGAEHVFLVDDDIYPIVKDWYKPYIDSGHNHLCMIFDKFSDGATNGNKRIKEENGITYFENPCGVLLYFKRNVFDVVGGMDNAFGLWGYEHVSLSQRIHNAGLTPHPFMDVTDSHKLFYAYDYHKTIERSVPVQTRVTQINQNKERFERSKTSKEYIDFRQGSNVIITTYFTKQVDPQRGKKWEANINDIRLLIDSCVQNNQEIIVLHDELGVSRIRHPLIKYIQVETIDNPYFQRWQSILDYLKENNHDKVFCVDATDVELLKLPWDEVHSGRLYTGYESGTVTNKWMLNYHNVGVVRQLFTKYSNCNLLNAGVLGGCSRMVIDFLERLLWAYNANGRNCGKTDMGLFNLMLHAQFRGVAESGAHVVSKFKQFENFDMADKNRPWFKHK